MRGKPQGLPANPDVERFVLGAILLDDSFYQDAAGALKPDNFSLETHSRIFKRMADLAGRGEKIDRVTLANELDRHGELQSCGGLTYLITLDDGLPRVSNIDSYIRIVKDKAVLRKIIFASQHITDRCFQGQETPDEILTGAKSTLLKLETTQTQDELQTPYEIIKEEISRNGIDALFAGGSKGIQTPLPWLNRTIAGLQNGDLILVGARPSGGKTALALQIAHCAAGAGHGCIFFSREMGGLPLSLRLACSVANVDSQLLRLGMLNREERGRLMAAFEDLKQLPLWIDKTCRTVAAMQAKLRRTRTKVKIELAVVDYIQLVATEERAENQNIRVSEISRGLKLMAEDYDLPVVALSQLSRPEKGQNPRPVPQDLRDSGSLEQDADVILFLHALDGNTGTGVRELIVAKQRNGPVDSTKVAFVGKFQRFEALAGEPKGEAA